MSGLLLPAKGAFPGVPIAVPGLPMAALGIGMGTDGTTWCEPNPN